MWKTKKEGRQKNRSCYMIPVIFSKCKPNQRDRKQISGGRGKELTAKRYKGTSWGKRDGLYLDCGSGYTTIQNFQDPLYN